MRAAGAIDVIPAKAAERPRAGIQALYVTGFPLARE